MGNLFSIYIVSRDVALQRLYAVNSHTGTHIMYLN